MQNKLTLLEQDIDYSFKNKETIMLALTHPSYANENKIEKYNTNQRLEFLGDAVLELVSSDFLYNNFKNIDEGQLTKIRAKLVCEESLSEIARSIKLYNYLLLGKGENIEKVKFNNSIMCDAIEALIGAIYLDSGLSVAANFVERFVLTDENINKTNHDYKSILQELANSHNVIIKYELVDESGPDHNKQFIVALHYGNKKMGNGTGKSKKDAEQNAACETLKMLSEGN